MFTLGLVFGLEIWVMVWIWRWWHQAKTMVGRRCSAAKKWSSHSLLKIEVMCSRLSILREENQNKPWCSEIIKEGHVVRLEWYQDLINPDFDKLFLGLLDFWLLFPASLPDGHVTELRSQGEDSYRHHRLWLPGQNKKICSSKTSTMYAQFLSFWLMCQ